MSEQNRVALFIDADNIPPRHIPAIMRELTGKYGEVTYRRAYGNWFHGNAKWEKMLARYSMLPVFQPSNASGKNSADIKLIIDAMDALYAGTADSFCIVSSDSDYTALAVRLREGGKNVIGIGERDKVKNKSALALACSKFIFVENLIDETDASESEDATQTGETPQEPVLDSEIEDIIVDTIVANSDGENGMNIGRLKQAIVNRQPDFDERTYGFSSFSKFLAGFEGLELLPADAPKTVRVVSGKGRTAQVFELIRNRVNEAGSRGCTITEIAGAINAAFPGLRLRALGYTRMRKLLEDVPGIQLVTDKNGEITVVAE